VLQATLRLSFLESGAPAVWGGAVRGSGLSVRFLTVQKSAARNQQLAPCSLKEGDEPIEVNIVKLFLSR
jgi:hypothetical protein